MGLDAAIDGLKEVLANLALQEQMRIYDDPPEGISEFPACMVYVREGEMSGVSAGFVQSFHVLIVDIYESRSVLPDAMDRAKRWPDSVMAALRADVTLGGAASGVVWPLRYRSGPMRYGTAVYFGVRFEVKVKVNGEG